MTRQRELDVHSFSGRERHEGAQRHTSFADVYAAAANFRLGLPQDGNRGRERAAEIAPSLSEDESVSGPECATD